MQIIDRQVAELVPYENNPRHNEDAVKFVKASIQQFGFKVPIVISPENVIIAGHTRVLAAKELGMETVPCVIADDLTEEQMKAFRLADNKVSEASGWDWDKLDQELAEIQHHAAAKLARKGWNVVDVCCGRSLMLPLLRYHAKNIASYTGVDISATNIREAMRGCSKRLTLEELKTYYPFRVGWKQCNVAEMTKVVPEDSADFVIYTSAIEHMHKDVGTESLKECYKIMRSDAIMFLSCPNTPGNGYNTQYAAHVYEWGYAELKAMLQKLGFRIEREVGLVFGAKEMKSMFDAMPDNSLKQFYEALAQYMPTEWLTAVMAIPFPQKAKEILFVVRK